MIRVMRFVLIICLLAALAVRTAFCAEPPPVVTSYRQMTQALLADSQASSRIRLVSLGESAKWQKKIWMARVSDPSGSPEKTIRILIMCRQHGDEPASTEAALKLLHGVAYQHDKSLIADLKNVTLYVIPMVNPDGADNMTRANGVGANLNRDWGVFSQPETRAVARAARLIRPQIIIDAHNWDGDDPYNANCIEVARMENSPLLREEHAAQQRMAHDLKRSGYSVFQTTYGTNIDPRLAHRYFTRLGILSVLVETHSGDPLDGADFQRRQGFYLALLHGIANRYGQGDLPLRLALNHLERSWTTTCSEQDLFTEKTAARSLPTAAAAAPRTSLAWLWGVCLYIAVVWFGGVGRQAGLSTPESGSETAPRPKSARASGRLSEGRPGTPRYRY